MSTNRRRPTGGQRRPQVAGRPRTAAPSGTTDSPQGADSALAVEERTDDRPGTGGGRERTDRAAGATTTGTSRGTTTTPDTGTSPDDAPGDRADDRERADALTARAGTDQAATPSAASPTEAPPRAAPVGGAGADARGARERLRRIPTPSAPTTRRGTVALLAATVLLAAAAVFFAMSWFGMTFTGAATNSALSDVGTTATVSEQVGEAVTKVYSFDFARLDQAESDARAGITGPFNQQFDQIFGNVRQLAPQQQAVVTATVPKTAVASIEGDRATVYLFVNQVITRVDDAGKPQQGGAAARLRVDAQYVDGRWKVSGMSPA